MSNATPSAATAPPLPAPRDPKLRHMANAIRALAMDAVELAKSGHPGMPMGMADVATVLFTQFLRFDPRVPDWPDRDRFVLSAGHGSMLLYALLYLTGYADMTLDELKRFRQLGRHGARRAALGGRVRRRDRRSPHLCLRWRRRPDGGDQSRGAVARRSSRPRQADRVLGRQLGVDRRPDRARGFR